MDWTQCKRSGFVRSVSVDSNLVGSLVRQSHKKLKSQGLLPLNDTTASSKLSLAYDSLRELLEALALQQGFKVGNHECYAAFLSEIRSDSRAGMFFDDVRKTRNKINYDGADVSVEEARAFIKGIVALRGKIALWIEEQRDSL